MSSKFVEKFKLSETNRESFSSLRKLFLIPRFRHTGGEICAKCYFENLLHNFRKNERSLERSYIRQWKSVQKYQPRGGTDSESVPKRVRSLIATNPGPSFRSPNLATNGKERRA